MGISNHVTEFAGLPVQDYEANSPSPTPCAHRVGLGYRDEQTFPELLDQFLTEHGGPGLTALVVGPWNYEEMLESSADVVEALVGARNHMPNLRALFLGDITFQECEISWIQHGDISPLLPAFPRLEEFRLRGATNVTFGRLAHPNLKSLVIESGGLPEALLGEVWASDLPMLEHLELWLGDANYNGIETIASLEPLLTGNLFPHLKYLGLRNSVIGDAIATALARSPLLNRIEVLDLSLGTVGDAGARALLATPAVGGGRSDQPGLFEPGENQRPEGCRLRRIDLHHHFMSAAVAAQFANLPIEVDVSDQHEPYSYNDGEAYRYVSVSE